MIGCSLKAVGTQCIPMSFQRRASRERPQPSKAARIPESEPGTIVECPGSVHVVTTRELLALAQQELARHAQVHNQTAAIVGEDGELLSAAVEARDEGGFE
jgi:hypothetical protein